MTQLRRTALLALLYAVARTPHVAAAEATSPGGVKQIEFATPRDHRPLWMAVFYPAAPATDGAVRHRVPFTVDFDLYADPPMVDDGAKHPLVILSHGRGSDAWQYAWLAQLLAAHGYIVAGLNHYRANTYEREIAYLANKIWQRPIDVSLTINHLLADPLWAKRIDRDRIAVAGHSQGGFTALWIGGARVNAERFLAFQRRFIANPQIPARIRGALPADATPALDVADARVKAVFAMAPGMVQAFGMDPDGLRQLKVPTFLIVGASDTQTPPAENAAFAAQYVPEREAAHHPRRGRPRDLHQRMRRRGAQGVSRSLHRPTRRRPPRRSRRSRQRRARILRRELAAALSDTPHPQLARLQRLSHRGLSFGCRSRRRVAAAFPGAENVAPDSCSMPISSS